MSFKDEIQKYLEIGMRSSKEVISKAGEAVSKFGDESVIRVEKYQFQNQLKQEISSLGLDVLKAFEDEHKESISAGDEEIASHIEKIKNIRAEIARKEEQLKAQK